MQSSCSRLPCSPAAVRHGCRQVARASRSCRCLLSRVGHRSLLPPLWPPCSRWRRRPEEGAPCGSGCSLTTRRRGARAARCAGCCWSPAKCAWSPTSSASSGTSSASAAGLSSASSWRGRCCRPPRARAWCGTTTPSELNWKR